MRVANGLTLFFGEKDFLSNWYRSSFEVKGIRFNCAEQYLMYAKARLFGDQAAAKEIMAREHPREYKLIGRRVKGFDEATWEARRDSILYAGLIRKFQQSSALTTALIATYGTELVEASERDCIWGVGLSMYDAAIFDKTKWRGLNRLGENLMSVRRAIYNHGSIETLERIQANTRVKRVA